MTVEQIINEILIEWAYRVNNGTPSPKNSEHISVLSEVLSEMGLSAIKDELLENLIGEETKYKNPVLNKIIKYKSDSGEDKEGIVGNLLRLKKGTPGRDAAEKTLPPEGTPERDSMNKELGSQRGDTTQTPKAGDGEKEQPKADADTQAAQAKMFTSDPVAKAAIEKEKDTMDKVAKADAEADSQNTFVNKIKNKLKNWGNEEKKFFQNGEHKPGSETRRTLAQAVKDKARGAVKAIKQGVAHEVHEFKEAGKGVNKFFRGEPLNEHEQKALKSVGIKIATTAVFGAAMGGLSHGAAYFAKHVAVEFIPHVVGETLLKGVGRAAIFADADGEAEMEANMIKFAEMIADGMENMEMRPEDLEKIVDGWNAHKAGIVYESVDLEEADGKQFVNPLLNKTIKYKNAKGEDAEGLIGNLLRLPKEHPGRQAAERQLPPEGSAERDQLNKDLGSEKDGKEQPTNTQAGQQPQQPQQTQNMFSNDPAMKAMLDKEKEVMAKLAKAGEPAPKQSQQSGEDWSQGKDGWEILDDERSKVDNIRDYSDEEYQNETGEYFDNDVTKNVAPNAFTDEADMIQKMKVAKPVFLSAEEMQNMSNTDVGDILAASEEGGKEAMLKLGKERAQEYGKDWDRLEKGIASNSEVPAPIALRDKNGDLHLVAGNTRLMSFTASGKKLPVKVIDYDGEFNYEGGSQKPTNTQFQPIDAADVQSEIPQADTDAFSGQSTIDTISSEQKKQISMKIDDLARMADEAKAKGLNAPNYNLCQVTVPGTNLYCDNNLGIPREEMPQFKGKPQAGSKAESMPKDASGEVDTEPVFREMLAKKGIKIVDTEIPSDALKATQSELVGAKVAGMTKALEKDPNHPKITAPIYVSRDGYVIDGHHRWAAMTSKAIKDGTPTNMKVRVIDMDAKDIIPMANKFAEEIGVAAKKADANSETPSLPNDLQPKVTDDKKGETAQTASGKRLYSLGGGYYSDTPNGDAKYVRTESVLERALVHEDVDSLFLLFEDTLTGFNAKGEEITVKVLPQKAVKTATAQAKKTAGSKKGEITKKYPPKTIKGEMQKLDSMDSLIASADKDTKTRVNILKKNWLKYLNADTKEEKIEALKELAEYKLIEGHAGGKKIYLSANTTLPYKHLTGSAGTSITEEMNQLIIEAGIDVPLRGGAKDRALADMSGKHNEAGVVSYLFPSDENKKAYADTQKSFKQLGGDEAKFDKINKKAADSIKEKLPKGAKITGAQQVGGIGKTELMKLGIDPKVDPTDLIIYYEMPNGKTGIMKVSAKTYSDPKNITMKNSGVNNAGITYLGELGKELDSKVSEMRKKFAWDDSMPEEKKAEQKKNLKQSYLSEFSKIMVELSKTEQGQKQLTKMWKDVHGCGRDVYTQIINKNTGEVEVKSPDYYCNPKPPYEIKYDGVKLVINMGGQDDTFIQIDMKTEDKGSPKLLFRHRTK
jgi:hypothetical protein